MTANGIEHPDFQNSKELARRDKEILKQNKIKDPKLGKYRVRIGNATFFFKTKERMEKSVIYSCKFKDRGIAKCLTNE